MKTTLVETLRRIATRPPMASRARRFHRNKNKYLSIKNPLRTFASTEAESRREIGSFLGEATRVEGKNDCHAEIRSPNANFDPQSPTAKFNVQINNKIFVMMRCEFPDGDGSMAAAKEGEIKGR